MSGLGPVGVNIMCGILLYIGIIIIISGESINNVCVTFFAFLFTGTFAANNLNFIPDIAQAKIAAINFFKIIDSED
jgi:hypothetical protein